MSLRAVFRAVGAFEFRWGRHFFPFPLLLEKLVIDDKLGLMLG